MLEERIVSKIKDLSGLDVEVEPKRTVKNNGVVVNGFVVSKAGSNIAPIIYIQDSSNDDEVVEYISNRYLDLLENNNMDELNIAGIFDKDNIYKNVMPCVINRDMNKKIFDYGVYHEPYFDMEVIYRIKVDGISSSVKITNDMISHFELDINILRESAKNNLEEQYEIRPMADILSEMLGLDAGFMVDNSMPPMYVISNKEHIYGASAIMSEKIMQDVHDMTGTDGIYIFPSSVHELIVVPRNEVDGDNEKDYKDMIGCVNDTEVQQEDLLSYNMYIHTRDGRMEVV